MNRKVRIELMIGQLLTMGEAFFYGTSVFVWASISFLDQNQLGGVFYLIATVLSLLIFCFALVGIFQSTTSSGTFKKGSAICSSVFNGLLFVGTMITLIWRDNGILPLTITFFFSFVALPTLALLVDGMVKASKEPFIDYAKQQETFALERGQAVSDLSALWKLYEQKLITEEEYINWRNTIFARISLRS